jgi:hypothetical protein
LLRILGVNDINRPDRNAIKSHLTQSRLKELEALAGMVEEYKKEKQGINPFPTEGSGVCDDIIRILKDIIKELKPHDQTQTKTK